MDWLGSYWFLTLALCMSIVLAVLGLLLVRNLVELQSLAIHHDVTRAFLHTVGTIYAVVLGFCVVGSFNTFEAARVTVEQESTALRDIFHLSVGLAPEVRRPLRKHCLDYADAMISDEWPAMAKGHESGISRLALSDLWETAVTFEPGSRHEQSAQESILVELSRLADARHARLCVAVPESHPIIWFVLITGAIITVMFLYMFGMKKLMFHVMMTALITLIIGLNIVLVAMFGYPFSGDVHVSPYAFSVDKELFQQQIQRNSSLPTRSLTPGGG